MDKEKNIPRHGFHDMSSVIFDSYENKTAASSYSPLVIVHTEEALIVILVLALWIAAIALFFNRWGKIRMLEPYQPKFIQQHNTNCPLIDQTPKQNRSFSKFNLNKETCFSQQKTLSSSRRNSVFMNSSMVAMNLNVPRKVQSAFDLQTLVLSEPGLNKCYYPLNVKLNDDFSRRQSWLANNSKKSGLEHLENKVQQLVERRSSVKDSSSFENRDRENNKREWILNESIGEEFFENETAVKKTRKKNWDACHFQNLFANESANGDSGRRDLISGQEPKHIMETTNRKSLCCLEKKSPFPKDFTCNFDDRGKLENARKNSMYQLGFHDSDRCATPYRDHSKSGVVDFRRNSMLIINTLTDDLGYQPCKKEFRLGGSSLALNSHLQISNRRNSGLPSGEECKQKINFCFRNGHQQHICRQFPSFNPPFSRNNY